MSDLGQDYFEYREHCEAEGVHPLDFNPWLVARLNALEDQLQSLLAILNIQEGDGR